MTNIVTISATYGSGGSVIAADVAVRLSLAVMDLARRGANASCDATEGLAEGELNRQPSGLLAQASMLVASTPWHLLTPTPDPAFTWRQIQRDEQREIQDAATAGDLVILGYAGAIVLSDHPSALHVRLDGPEHLRARQAARWLQLGPDTAEASMKRTDAIRARAVRRLYGRDADDPRLHHLKLDTTAMPFSTCAEIIAEAAQAHWAFTELPPA